MSCPTFPRAALFAAFLALVLVPAGLRQAQASSPQTDSLADIPYAADAGFPLVTRRDTIVGGGTYGATSVVELVPGGDVVTAGIVTGQVSLQRVTNAGRLGMWPSNASGLLLHAPPADLAFRSVTDMKVFDGRLYVLANRQRSTTVTTNDVHVLVFDLAGNFLSDYVAMGDFRDEYGAGMVVYQTLVIGGATTTWMSVIGHRVLDAVESNPFLTRARVEGNGLVRDTGIGDVNGYVQIPVPGGLCTPYNEACSMEVARIAVKPTGLIGGVPAVYVGGSIRTGGTDWDYGLLCISGSGSPCSGFGDGGFVRRGFNNGGSMVDRVTGIAVRRFGTFGAYTYTVYLTGNVARRCEAGIGVAGFEGDTGATDFSFGLLGRVLVGGYDGGSGSTAICFLNDGPDVAEDAALSGNHLFIAGTRFYEDFGGTAHSDIQSLVLDATGRVVDGLRAYEPAYPYNMGASLPTESALRGVRTDAAGRFVVAGAAYTPTAVYREAFVSGRFVQDRIFGSSFD